MSNTGTYTHSMLRNKEIMSLDATNRVKRMRTETPTIHCLNAHIYSHISDLTLDPVKLSLEIHIAPRKTARNGKFKTPQIHDYE